MSDWKFWNHPTFWIELGATILALAIVLLKAWGKIDFKLTWPDYSRF